MNDDTTPYEQSQLDQTIGSILESWVNRETGEYCRFCGVEQVDAAAPEDKFCSESCRESFDQVFDARLEIGKRDMEQRGYD